MTRSSRSVEGLPKMALHGDWPWHVALFKEDVHVCDGTLISSEWLVTTASCFQGQPKAEWTARFGTVRLSSSTPWEQERRIVGKFVPPSAQGIDTGHIRRDSNRVIRSTVGSCRFQKPLSKITMNNLQPIGIRHCGGQLTGGHLTY